MTVTASEQARVAARSPAIDPSDRRAARIAGIYLAVKGFKASSPIVSRTSSA